MKAKKELITLLFVMLCIFRTIQIIDTDDITIQHVSRTLDHYQRAQGSFLGGTIIYIKGTGFHTQADKNAIHIGPYPCRLIADGATQNFLSCRTTAPSDPQVFWWLTTTIAVDGKKQYTCSASECRFNYRQDMTPYIDQIAPRSVGGKEKITIYGYHQIADLGDGRSHGEGQIENIQINGYSCSLVDVQQKESINPDGRQPINCLAPSIQAGEYNNFVELVERGYARLSFRTQQTSLLTGRNYTQRIVPTIDTISSHQGGQFGQEIIVKGKGFSRNAQNYECKVAGQICEVKMASDKQAKIVIPSKSSQNSDFGKLPQSSQDTAEQMKPYLGGQGARYTRINRNNMYKSSDDWFTYLREGNGQIVQQKIVTELFSPNIYGQNYVQYIQGYFYAPISGQYKFTGIADDQLYLKIANIPNTANPDYLEDIIVIDQYNYDIFVPFLRPNEIDRGSKIFEQGNYYYFEIVSINYGGPGYYKIQLQTPLLSEYSINPTWQLEKISIKPTEYQAQQIQVRVTGTSGQFSLTYYQPQSFRERKANIDIGASADNFRNKLRNLPNINNFKPSVTLQKYDAAGLQIVQEAEDILVQTYVYKIFLQLYRPLTDLPILDMQNVTTTGTLPVQGSIERLVEHSPPISGTFKILLDNTPLQRTDESNNFEFDVNYYYLERAFEKYFNNQRQIIVRFIMGVRSQEAIEFIIQYAGIIQQRPPLTFDLTLLNGGKQGSSIEANIQILRPYSNNQLYSPLPYDFLHAPSEKPNLELIINSIPAKCLNCQYQIIQGLSPSVSTYLRTGSTIDLGITYPEQFDYSTVDLQDIQVSLLGAKCTNKFGAKDNFNCSLNSIASRRRLLETSDPILPAGSGQVQVHIQGYGFADTTGSTVQNIPLTVTSITPDTASEGGLIEATLIGTGFPISLEDSIIVQICGQQINTFKSITNSQIVFEIPPQTSTCDGSNTFISVNGVSQTFIFTYDSSLNPTITSISRVSSSPILKSTLTITGSNFGTTTDTKVYLYKNNMMKYQLTTVSVTQTTINCILGGGKSGEYDIRVYVPSKGASVPNQMSFQYRIFINSISPDTGSKGGGYTLTISGSNLAPSMGSNNVFIGHAMNNFCQIISATDTQITCIMPAIHDNYNVGDPLDVVVTGRILEESVCTGSCSFTYQQGISANFVDEKRVFIANQQVALTGSGLMNAIVKIGGVQANIITDPRTDTDLVFNFPALPTGQYQIIVQVSGGTRTYPRLFAQSDLQFQSLRTSGGSETGHSMLYFGNGFPEKQKIDVWLVCTKISKLQILSAVPNQINFMIPPFTGNQDDRVCRVNITIGRQHRHHRYQYLAAQTLLVETVDQGENVYTITEVTQDNRDFNKVQFVLLDDNGELTTTRYNMQITVVDGNSISVTAPGSYLPAGTFKVLAHKQQRGFSVSNPDTFTINFQSTPSLGSQQIVSFAGGKEVIISGIGFVDLEHQNNDIKVCGIRANIKEATQSQVIIQVPALVTISTQQNYDILDLDLISGKAISDVEEIGQNVLDGSFNTIYSSTNDPCYVGIDFGENMIADIFEIKYAPNPLWAVSSDMLDGAIFQGSNDSSTWTTIFNVQTNNVHSGWNTWKNSGDKLLYRYVRFSHNSLSNCEIADIQVIGYKYSDIVIADGAEKVCNVQINLENDADDIIISQAITYSPSATSIVNLISPQFGSSLGGQQIQISGTNLGSSVSVTIDGIECEIVSNNQNQIVCQTGLRSTPPQQGNSFVVVSDGNIAIINTEPYIYTDRWSQQSTWGGQAIPREGDSVYVPKGMTLLVDQSTPILDSIIVEGKIKFADQADIKDNAGEIKLDAHYFVIISGQFQAGKQGNPYQSQLTITLHGGYYDKQLPTFGNKVLGCLNCLFNMHGKERLPTWTLVENTISPGDVTFRVLQAVDWQAGEVIAVAATGFDHYQSQERIIQSVSADGMEITVTQPFIYKHYSAVQTYSLPETAQVLQFPMRAQVALLTRNIKVQGNEGSVEDKYGSHLMLTGRQNKGLIGKISYAQFTKCGQPRIMGRYCTHFHMAGDVPKSYVRGISVHHSIARVITIHGTHYLLVEKSVGYRVQGHNFFLQDGIETNNVLQDNLAISSIESFLMMQTDITVAGFWITNPYNTLRRNHAAGSDFYGHWYEIKEHPDGPSATSDICPMGMQLGQSRDNVAHSTGRFGLRIFKLSARKYPCQQAKDESAQDPYLANQAYQSVFDNYTLWRNQECGFLGQELGYTTIKNFKTVDSKKGGLQFHKTNYTKQLVVVENSYVIGFSQGNAPEDVDVEYNNARGIIAPRTDGLKVSGVTFLNFGSTMTPLQSCSECFTALLWVTGGKTTFFQNIKYDNIQGNYIFWQKWRRQIFIDLDGSLTQPIRSTIDPAIPAQSRATITPFRPSLMIADHCYHIDGQSWDDSIYCDQTIVLRGLLFTNPIPLRDFNNINIKVNLLDDPAQDISQVQQTDFSLEPMIIIKGSKDIKNSWAMPFATNRYYNVHWRLGIDFMHMALAPSRLWDENDGIVLRFNYTDQRQLYQIFKFYEQNPQRVNLTDLQSNQIPDPTNCNNGDFHQDVVNEQLFVCISGRDKKIQQWININGIRCRQTCPQDQQQRPRQNFDRFWSEATNWPGQRLPAAGENVTIPYEWNMVIDIDPPQIYYLQVNGILKFDSGKESTVLQAHYIWIKQGILRAGSPSTPFTNNIDIILHGQKDDSYLVLDPSSSGNKMLAVTGGLELYGIQPETVWTKLVAKAPIGSTSITVESVQGWNVGDKIVVAPSYTGRKQFEQLVIDSISGNTIGFSTPLQYEHYGDAQITIDKEFADLDARSAVGLVNRNIRISRGQDQNGWGCRVLIYRSIHYPVGGGQPTYNSGYAKLFGVQFDQCGQYDTTYAGLRIERLGYSEIQGQTTELIDTTQVIASSFHHCGGMCMYMDDNKDVTITNNFVFNGKKFLVYVHDLIGSYTFTNNLLVGALKRQNIPTGTGLVDDVACYEQYVAIKFEQNHGVTVTNNLCQGSEGEGFVFPSTPCEYLDTYPFVDNTVGSAECAFMYETLQGQSCLAAKGAIAYASQIGLQANQPGSHKKLIYEQMLFADNGRGITLRYAHETDENACILRNSYFAGYSRPNCLSCYSSSTISYCQGGYAVRMFVATITGQRFPLLKNPLGHDVICTRQSFDFKAFVQNVVFQNYLYDNEAVPFCTGMSVFRRHNLASDGTASHHLTNTSCVNCQDKSWAFFEKPNVGWRGWFGGCGQLDCTGPNNYLIHDHDGSFLGRPSQLLSNNSVIGDKQDSCTYIPQMNGHWCDTQQFAVLEYQSKAADFNKRVTWPVYLKYDGGNWTSVTNAWRQWQWDGPQPMNRRLNRFWSVVKLGKTYNMTFSSMPPVNLICQIQKRELPDGIASDWVVVRVYYPIPNSIQVSVKNNDGTFTKIQSFLSSTGSHQDLTLHSDTCGANNYHFENGTIQFVVNGNNCQVRIKKTSFVQVSARLNIQYDAFLTNDGPTTLLTNIAAYLQIDPGRLKIVSVMPGSVDVVYQITQEQTQQGEQQQTQQQTMQQLQALNQRLTQAVQNQETSQTIFGGQVLSFQSQVTVVVDDGDEYRSCSGDVGSTGVSLPNGQCKCKLYHEWNKENERCEPTCNTHLHVGINPEDQLKCDCREHSYWDDNQRRCLLDCENIQHSVGQWESETVCQCDEISKWNSKDLTCDINCEQMRHSTGQFDQQNNVCVCQNNYLLESGYCVRDCLNMDYAISRDGDICICEQVAIWHPETQRCIIVDCENIPYASGQGEGFTCQCQQNFIWNSEVGSCQIQCANLDDPLGQGININIHTCQCSENAIWEQSALSCVLNCSDFQFSTGRNTNATACQCVQNYRWNYTHCQLGCGFNPGQLAEFDYVQQHCKCDQAANYQWSYTQNACYYQCYLVDGAQPDYGPQPQDCICFDNYQWSRQDKTCTLKCDGEFDVSKISGQNRCQCEENAFYSVRDSTCVVNCYRDRLSTRDVDVLTGKCICKDNASWSDETNTCECDAGYEKQGLICQEITSSAVGIAMGVIGGSLATAATIFTGIFFKSKRNKAQNNDKQQQNEQPVNIESAENNQDQLKLDTDAEIVRENI